MFNGNVYVGMDESNTGFAEAKPLALVLVEILL
jgi:hypothetical protein